MAVCSPNKFGKKNTPGQVNTDNSDSLDFNPNYKLQAKWNSKFKELN